MQMLVVEAVSSRAMTVRQREKWKSKEGAEAREHGALQGRPGGHLWAARWMREFFDAGAI